MDFLKHRSPALFKSSVGETLASTEKNGEVNRFLGWAIFSAQQRFEDNQSEYKILQAMQSKLDNIDEDYVQKYYDRHVSLLNTGGLTLVSRDFFEWGRKVMAVSRQRLSKDLLKSDPKTDFAAEKEAILQDKSLQKMFREI